MPFRPGVSVDSGLVCGVPVQAPAMAQAGSGSAVVRESARSGEYAREDDSQVCHGVEVARLTDHGYVVSEQRAGLARDKHANNHAHARGPDYCALGCAGVAQRFQPRFTTISKSWCRRRESNPHAPVGTGFRSRGSLKAAIRLRLWIWDAV